MLLLPFVFIYLIGSTLAVPIKNVGHFAGRSGDIIIQTENAIHEDSAILLHGKSFEGIELKTIEDVRVADLFAHVMGTQPFNVLANRDGFPKGNLFVKPRATLLFTLDSIAPELYAKYTTGKDYQRVDITSTTFPANTHTLASNLATGTRPSVHGIVGESWVMPNGEKVAAHDATDGTSLAANIADILTQQWSSASLTVSASAATSLASTFAVNQQLAGARTYGLSLQNGGFSSIYTESAIPLSLSNRELNSIFEDSPFSSFLGASKININNNQITVTVGSNTATYDISTVADFSLFAELGFVYNLINKLETDPILSTAVADSVPDFFSFVFSSLKDIKTQYGDSEVFKTSIILVDNAIQQAVAQLEKLYADRLITAVICLNTQTFVPDNVREAVYSAAHSYLLNDDEKDFDLHFPSLYVQGSNAGHVCSEIKNALDDASVSVHCFTSAYNWILDDNVNDQLKNTTAAPLNVAAFWIFVFLPLSIALIVLAGIYSLCAAGIDASKDSLLFRSAGRGHHHN